jgi:hypothetical protein
MTHPCEEERHGAAAERKVISLAYTPEIIERKRARRLAREAAWRAAEALEGWRCVIRALAVGMARADHAAAIAMQMRGSGDAGSQRHKPADRQAPQARDDSDFGPDLGF